MSHDCKKSRICRKNSEKQPREQRSHFRNLPLFFIIPTWLQSRPISSSLASHLRQIFPHAAVIWAVTYGTLITFIWSSQLKLEALRQCQFSDYVHVSSYKMRRFQTSWSTQTSLRTNLFLSFTCWLDKSFELRSETLHMCFYDFLS